MHHIVSKNAIKPHDHTQSPNPVIITKDEEYFIEGTFVVFQVEKCLFRIPSYLISKESHVFGDMFRLPQVSEFTAHDYVSPDPRVEGSSEANPIILPDEFTKADFRCLLKALYPLSFTFRPTLSKEEWLSILKLSNQWYFLNLRKTAIAELHQLSLSPLENIIYGRKYRVSSWLISGLADLVTREESINDELALDIDSEYPTTAYRLFRAREKRIRGYLKGNKVTKEMEYRFKKELDNIRSDEEGYGTPEVDRVLEVEEPEEQTLWG